MVNSTDFAKRLEKILHYYGLSATAFSEKIDFNRSTISHLLSGRNKPSLEFVMKVLKQFPEVELYWLLNGSGNFPATSVSEKENSTPNVEMAQNLKKWDDSTSDLPTTTSEKQKEGLRSSENASDIERIVIFYKDGSFKAYQ